jgi:hypothetical protein
MGKKVLILLVILALGFLGWKYWTYRQNAARQAILNSDPAERASQLDINSFTFGAKVLAVREGSLWVETGWVQDGRIVAHERGIGLNSSAKVYLLVDDAEPTLVEGEDPISNIVVGDEIVVYTKGNPYQSDFIMSSRIDVMR